MEVGLLLLVMLMVFGPRRIGDIGKSLGEGISSFRKASRDEKEPEETTS
jgi:sec-independent protein translocase protein TatA